MLEAARHAAARAVNSIMTATYWEIGRRFVEHEQGGKNRAGYGERLIDRLSYSENELEEGLIRHLETFLLELGDDFTFVGRQRRLRVDDEWFRVDLV